MRKRLLMMFAVGCLGVIAAAGTAIAGGGNSGAAQTCQQGGYLNMQRSDGSSFKNVGDCVSYFAQGGTAEPACTVVPGVSGCMTFDNVVPDASYTGDTITLNGSFSFSTTACPDTVIYGYCASQPNAYATGGGTYTIRDASGNVLESGTLVADNTPGTSEGLVQGYFTDANGNVTTSCSAAASREVAVNASTGNPADPNIYVQGIAGATTSDNGIIVLTDAGGSWEGGYFQSDTLSGITINC